MPVFALVLRAFTQLTELEPTFSAREAAALLNRSCSWLDQRLRQGELVRPDGSATQPLRSLGGYRYFTFEMLEDIVNIATDNARTHFRS
jgi:hypothetical protein